MKIYILIFLSLIFLFADDIAKSAKVDVNNSFVDKKDEELRLLLQVFLYDNDIENAYKAAKLGYKRDPNSIYWNQKMAETSKWSGRNNEAIKYMFFIYEKTKDQEVKQNLINYGLQTYQYESIEDLVVSNALSKPTKENIDLMEFVYSEIGFPEKSAAILEAEYNKESSKIDYLSRALRIYTDIGDLTNASRIVNILEKNKLYTKETAIQITYFYYTQKNMDLAYEKLLIAKKFIDDEDIKYLQLLSDLGWYMQDYSNGAEVIKKLMSLDNARIVDYERVIQFYQGKDLDFVLKACKEAYKKHQASYLFYYYANNAVKLNRYDDLKDFMTEIDNDDTYIKNEALYWVIKAQVFKYYKDLEMSKSALKVAQSLDLGNLNMKLTLFWFYIENHFDEELKTVLKDLEETQNISDEYYMPMASAYFYLQDIDRASYYLQQLTDTNHYSVNSLDFKFLKAYIYKAQNDEDSFNSSIKTILKELEENGRGDSSLLKNDTYLNRYLRASLYTLSADEFQKKLFESKEYLLKKNYDEISYSFAIDNGAYEDSGLIYQNIQNKEIWHRFNNAVIFQNRSEIEDMLELYLASLPVDDASSEAKKDGQIALSQTLAYDSLDKNSYSENSYIQHLSLSKDYANKFDAKFSHYKRDELLQKSLQLNNKIYILNGWYLFNEVDYVKNSILDENLFNQIPKDTIKAGMELRKIYDKVYFDFGLAYHESMKNYLSYKIDASYQMSKNLKTDISYEKNKEAKESIGLLLGGKKTSYDFKINWNVLNSTSLNILYELNDYSSQDDVELTKGSYARISASKAYRLGYPDISVEAFYDYGAYSAGSNSLNGTIDMLYKKPTLAVPKDFYNIGAVFNYGMVNSNSYTRVWRPFFSFSPYYNGQSNSFNFGFDGGMGGKIFNQDHLVFGLNYSESVNGVSAKAMEFYIKYHFLYAK
ncbi:MAG: tetratricopeptide repeat protein [Sulfurimonas sp.]|uniref:tetratricopeptide repeat protein n=1 Tax=Sulfurimonas sp. TaxID=2022749 RepID=UPI00262E3C18|nr:tetratricopeptide repeat protein [Sulfurimonas sp.]MDD5400079.1 tetratricopeptide repeat protein [Sulfurimonas sp.]